MEEGLTRFLGYYNLYRRHGSLLKELNVRAPFVGVQKWYLPKPELFKITPEEFKGTILKVTKSEKVHQ